MGHKMTVIALIAFVSSCTTYTYQADVSKVRKDAVAQPDASKPEAGKVASNGIDDQKHVVIQGCAWYDPLCLGPANLRRAENEELAIKMGQPYASSAHGGIVSQNYGDYYDMNNPAFNMDLAYAQAWEAQSMPTAQGTGAPTPATPADSAEAKAKAEAALQANAVTADEIVEQRAELEKLKAKDAKKK